MQALLGGSSPAPSTWPLGWVSLGVELDTQGAPCGLKSPEAREACPLLALLPWTCYVSPLLLGLLLPHQSDSALPCLLHVMAEPSIQRPAVTKASL